MATSAPNTIERRIVVWSGPPDSVGMSVLRYEDDAAVLADDPIPDRQGLGPALERLAKLHVAEERGLGHAVDERPVGTVPRAIDALHVVVAEECDGRSEGGERGHVELLRIEVERRKLHLDVAVPATLPKVSADPDQLRPAARWCQTSFVRASRSSSTSPQIPSNVEHGSGPCSRRLASTTCCTGSRRPTPNASATSMQGALTGALLPLRSIFPERYDRLCSKRNT
jgi:hypothetical protein